MAKDPAFLFYPNDYLGGTMGMTFEEKGAYMELLMLQFNRGHMTKHMMAQTVGQLLDKLLDKFEIDSHGLYFNSRLELEKEKRKAFVNSRLNNKLGKNQYSKPEGHMTSHMENENETIKEDEIIKDPEFKKFTDWILKNAPNVAKLKEPFTLDQFKEVKEKYDSKAVKEILKSMHNYKPLLKKNISAYLTLCNWIARRDEGKQNTDQNKVIELDKVPFNLKKANA